MLYDIIHFNTYSRKVLETDGPLTMSVGEYLEKERYSEGFREAYLIVCAIPLPLTIVTHSHSTPQPSVTSRLLVDQQHSPASIEGECGQLEFSAEVILNVAARLDNLVDTPTPTCGRLPDCDARTGFTEVGALKLFGQPQWYGIAGGS